MASHGLNGMYKMTFSMVSILQIRSGWMERWKGGVKGKKESRRRAASEPVQRLDWSSFSVWRKSAADGQVKTLQERGEEFCFPDLLFYS